MASTQRSSTFSLSLLFLFIALSLYHFQYESQPSSPDPPQSQTLPPNSTQHGAPPRRNYIVRFRKYNTAQHHRAYLESNLRSRGWEWIERRNPAAKFPTDFGLILVEDSVTDGLTRKIRTLALVKDVHVDMGYTRGLLNKDQTHKGGAFLGGKKRPGKIFTPMSFSEAHGDGAPNCSLIHNSSVKLGRQLLMQVKIRSFFLLDHSFELVLKL